MKVGIYDPYLDTLGGGEKYVFNLAHCLAKKHNVFMFWRNNKLKEEAEMKFGIDLSNIEFTENIFLNKTDILTRVSATRRFDVIFYLSDGSVPFLFAKKNILHFQFPIPWVRKTLLTSLKLKNIHSIVCNSQFVKDFVDKKLVVQSQVIFPPVKQIGKKGKKKNLILNVGRFTRGMNRKKQEVLVDVFKNICKKGLKEWRLVLAGSHLVKDKDLILEIKKRAQGFPIDVSTNISYSELLDYYYSSKIYWHATGFGEDLNEHPEYAEHFGITTVEAMSAGLVPVVINSGGQREIVIDGKNGFLWNTVEELEKKTIQLIKNSSLLEKMSLDAQKRAQFFSEERFCKEIMDLVEK